MNTLKKAAIIVGSIPGLAVSAARYWSISVQMRFVKFVAGSFER